MVSLIAWIIIRNLGLIALGDIFLALRKAAVVPAFWFPCMAVAIWFFLLRKRKHPVLWLVVLLLVSLVPCILFSRVNGVVFNDVLASLLSLVKQGVLDEL